jgi:hypothetical protein
MVTGARGKPLFLRSLSSAYIYTSMLPKSGMGLGMLVIKVSTQHRQLDKPHDGWAEAGRQRASRKSRKQGAGQETEWAGGPQLHDMYRL